MTFQEVHHDKRDYRFLPENFSEIPELYSQDGKGKQATVYIHYYWLNSDWFITEVDQNDYRAFGWACLGDLQNAEFGYCDLVELEKMCADFDITVIQEGGPEVKLPFKAYVERDLDWQPKTLEEAIKERYE